MNDFQLDSHNTLSEHINIMWIFWCFSCYHDVYSYFLYLCANIFIEGLCLIFVVQSESISPTMRWEKCRILYGMFNGIHTHSITCTITMFLCLVYLQVSFDHMGNDHTFLWHLYLWAEHFNCDYATPKWNLIFFDRYYSTQGLLTVWSFWIFDTAPILQVWSKCL